MIYLKCPRCGGWGETMRPPHVPLDQPTWTDTRTGPYTCTRCNGTGLVPKPEDEG